MSMPTFPENGIDISEEQAFNMILASIAMEELALSHIMNAEGEKLQYVLGTLKGKQGGCATTQELLEVNRSITNLLDTVMHNQLLLKGKLERVLEYKASNRRCCDCSQPCPPPCNCDCDCDRDCNCNWDCNVSPTPTPVCPACPPQDALRLIQARAGCCWRCESPFSWQDEQPRHQSPSLKALLCHSDPSLILLCSGITFSVHFSLHFQNRETQAVSVTLELLEPEGSRCLHTFQCCGRNLKANAILSIPTGCEGKLCLRLHCPDCVHVERATMQLLPLRS